MTYADDVINEQVDICSAVNEFFLGNFNKPVDQYYTGLLGDDSHFDRIHSIQLNKNDILKVMKDLDVAKGAGSDSIPPIFFNRCAESLSITITLIFNKCLQVGYFPSIWKKAHIVLVHKKGSKIPIEN